MKKALLSLLVVLSLFACQQFDKVVLENGKMRLEFDKENATLLSMVDLETGYEYLDTEAEPQRLWNIIPLNEEDVIAEPTDVKVRSSRLTRRKSSGRARVHSRSRLVCASTRRSRSRIGASR